jgi:hypothetical protein
MSQKFSKKKEKHYRHLTAAEIDWLKSIFSQSLDYSRIRIYRAPYFLRQRKGVAVAPNGHIYFHPQDFCEDFSQKPITIQAWFIHEITHVWQHQHGTNVLLKGLWLHSLRLLSFGFFNPYSQHNINFYKANIEQQATFLQNRFLNKQDCLTYTSAKRRVIS